MKTNQINFPNVGFIHLRDNTISDFYDFIPQELGTGSYGKVYKAQEKTGGKKQWRAVKQIEKKTVKQHPHLIKNEIENLSGLDHPTVIKIYEIFEDAQNYYLITDLCQGGQLFQKLIEKGQFSQKDARVIFKQIVEAIAYCHQHKIAHRDIKPQNFMFLNSETFNLKLIDFGFSLKWKNNMKQELLKQKDTKLVGTAYYVSPEMIQGKYDQRCDIWSAGIILHALVAGILPFDGANQKQIIAAIDKGFYSLAIPQMKNVTPMCKDLIKKLLMPENKRPSIKQIFNHPWMNQDLPTTPLEIDFQKMAKFNKLSKLTKLTANLIVRRMSQKQIEDLGAQFRSMDVNHDGQISLQELKSAFTKQNQGKSSQQLKQMFEGIDIDQNGKISYTEFVACQLEEQKIFTQQNLRNAFDVIGSDIKGIVSSEQFIEKNSYHKIKKEMEMNEQTQQCIPMKNGQRNLQDLVGGMPHQELNTANE